MLTYQTQLRSLVQKLQLCLQFVQVMGQPEEGEGTPFDP